MIAVIVDRWAWMARGVNNLFSTLRMWRCSGGSMNCSSLTSGGGPPDRTMDRSTPYADE